MHLRVPGWRVVADYNGVRKKTHGGGGKSDSLAEKSVLSQRESVPPLLGGDGGDGDDS